MPDETVCMPVGTASATPAGPCAMVIFGGTGDLTQRLLAPSLYNLACSGLLPEHFALIGLGTSDLGDAGYRKLLDDAVVRFVAGKAGAALDRAAWARVVDRIHYLRADLNDPESYRRLGATLATAEAEHHTGGNVLFYLAVASRFFGPAVEQLGQAGLVEETDGRWRRVVIEKPFGQDLPSARDLNRRVLTVLGEDQVFRMDHFLGKETVQNILVFRFANGIFEPLWSRDHIDHVQITVAETVGVEQRGRFYDQTGAMRDMVPNHVFQLLALTAMEPPTSFGAAAVRTERVKALDAVHAFGPEDALLNVVRGQYGAGAVKGQPLGAYREQPDVARDSRVETYVAMKIMIDNWRWAGVPFYLRTGKALSARDTEIAITFKRAPFTMFRDTPVERLARNVLVLQLQPDEGVSLTFGAKVPGPMMQMGNVEMAFKYADYFHSAPTTGYETLLYDCMIGDATLFQRADSVEAGWRIVQPVLDAWAAHPPEDFPNYAAGSAGPETADRLIERGGRRWRPIG